MQYYNMYHKKMPELLFFTGAFRNFVWVSSVINFIVSPADFADNVESNHLSFDYIKAVYYLDR